MRKFLEEVGHYEYLSGFCPHCAAEGKQAQIFINTGIPVGEYDEIALEEEEFSNGEIDARKQIRDLMWAKRPDLKTKDRDAHNKKDKHKLDARKAHNKQKFEELLANTSEGDAKARADEQLRKERAEAIYKIIKGK